MFKKSQLKAIIVDNVVNVSVSFSQKGRTFYKHNANWILALLIQLSQNFDVIEINFGGIQPKTLEFNTNVAL